MTCAEVRSRRRRDRSPWWFPFSGRPRPSRPSGDHPTAGGPGLHRGALATAAGAQRRTAGGGYFVSRCKAGLRPAAENSRRPPLRARAACRPIALLKAAGAALCEKEGSPQADAVDAADSATPSSSRRVLRVQESWHVFQAELDAQGRAKIVDAELSQVFVEIAQRRRQRERLDPGQLRPFGQGRDRDVSRRIAVACDIEAA